MSDPYLAYILSRQPATLDQALVLFDEVSKGPDKSSPHVVEWRWVEENLCWNIHRKNLIVTLRGFLSRMGSFGGIAELVLIGGSFVSRLETPKDIDFLLVYRADTSFRSEEFAKFATTNQDGLDFKLIPSDTGVISLLKISIFYHLLFQGRKGGEGSIIISI